VLREDYVTRLVAQLARALSHILGLSRKRQYPAALVAIDEALDQLLGLRADSVLDLSADQLVAFLTLGGMAAEGWDKVSFLAALLQEAGTIHAAQDCTIESYECYQKALHLVLEASLHDDKPALPDYAPTVEGLTAALQDYILPAHTNLALLRYYEQVGAYALAEDALFEALEAEPENADVVETGLALYARLWQQSDEALVAGNLPRDEVAAGWAELRNWRSTSAGGSAAVSFQNVGARPSSLSENPVA